MANKSKSSGKVSNGGRQKANLAHEAKRQAKFAAKREAGKAYKYQPNPYKKGSDEWAIENERRAEKVKSKKLPQAYMDSLYAKLDNQLAKAALERKEFLEKKKAKKSDKENN